MTVPKIQAVNPVGLQRGYADRELLTFACACGSANALEQGTGIVNPKTVNRLVREIQVTKLPDD